MDDPKAMARWAKEMGKSMGDEMGEEFPGDFAEMMENPSTIERKASALACSATSIALPGKEPQIKKP